VENIHRRGRFGLASGIVLACLLPWCPHASALNPALDVSQYAHTAWKIREGFAKGEILSIAQTPDGYLWLGTEFGLLRFDGVRAVPWQPPGDQPLPSSNIESLLVARDGTLWIGTWKGLASWKDAKLTQYPELAGLLIMALLEDRDGTIWAGGFAYSPPGKLCAIRNGTAHCYGEDSIFGKGPVGLYEDGKGNLWAGVLNGLWRWKPGPAQFYPLPGGPAGIQGLAEENDGGLLIAMPGRVAQFVGGKAESKYSYPSGARDSPSRTLLRDRDGGLWIGAWGHGLVHVHRGTTDTFAKPEGLSGNTVTALFQDRERNIWVATETGLDRFRDFAVVTLSEKEGFSTKNLGAILAARDGSIWQGTDGLRRCKNGQITFYHEAHAKAGTSRAYVAAKVSEVTLSGLRKYEYGSLFEDDRGRIWVAADGGVGYLENDRLIPLRAVPSGVVYSITGDSKGNLWIANWSQGLLHLRHDRLIEQIPWVKFGHKSHASALAINPSRGGLWLGFYDGGIAYLADGQVRAKYAGTDGLGQGHVNSLRLDQDGTLWVATEGGLSRLKDERIATLTSKNGLPCDTVHWAMEDDHQGLWLYMTCGLVRIAHSELDAWGTDPNRKVQTTLFNSLDGVSNKADAPSLSPNVAKSADGRLWFTTYDGVNVVDPSYLPFNKLPPPVHVEQVTADRKTYDAAFFDVTGDANRQVRLPPLVRDLEIDYTALSLVAPERVLFRYKLEGRDRDWQDARNRRQAFYTDLSPRKYRFRVMACNNSGVWNEAGTFLDFSVAPAYYQTTRFRLSCVAAFLAFLGAFYQLRLRQVAHEFNMRMEERVSERTRIARELHDSLLQGFQGLMFRLQAVRDMLPGLAPAEAIEALDIALERGDKAIAEGRDTVSDLREPIMGDSDIAQALTALGKELALQSGNGLVPCVRVLLEGKQRELNPMLRDEIYRIAREALRNAFRHARAQKIEAEITYSDSEFLLHVRDDGGGIDPEVANQGARAGHWGLPGMRERAKSFGGKLEVWSEHGAGTEIELSVPGAIAYGKSEPRRGFWLWRKKIGESDGQQS
jgi:signal transduction histidine kinase/ligand-binding sensor domain-containing protein